jgi:hypothetical protein
MKCVICGIELDTINEAIEQDWKPNFYEGEKEYGPACYSCADAMLCMDEDGEMELKPEYHGKIQYVDGDYSSVSEKPGELMIGIAIIEEKEDLIH